MSQCVPSWGLDENTAQPRQIALRAHSNSNSITPHVPMLDYEVAELTWENGQLSMHGLGPPRVDDMKPHSTTNNWEKPRAGGTLESIVDQATTYPAHYLAAAACKINGTGEDLVPWFNHQHPTVAVAAASTTVSMDALVPCSNAARDQLYSQHMLKGVKNCVAGSSTRVGSCTAAEDTFENNSMDDVAPRLGRVPRVPVVTAAASTQDWTSSSFDSRQVTLDTCEKGLGAGGFTSTSMGSPENTSSGQQCTKATTTADEHDSACHSRPQRNTGNEEGKKKGSGGKSSLATKRRRAAAIHNQSERKRRDKINQRMKTLQKLVPNSSKTDKASMLDEVIEYLKQLQAQVNMMNRMNMSPMMLPLTIQQQLQMSMMAQMGMGMGMPGGVMDLNSIGRVPNHISGFSPMLNPAHAFIPLASWDGTNSRLSGNGSMVPDPMSAFLACQSQPMNMDAYSRMAALYQQLHQVHPPGSKK